MSGFAAVAAEQLDVRYSQVWEDHRLLARALELGPDSDVLSIASAGDNVIALLLEEPRSIVAVDVSPAQTALFELKLTAIKELAHEDLVAFLGARPSAARAQTYAALRPNLTAEVREYWDARAEVLERGVIACGMLDRYILAFADRFVTPAMRAFVELDDLEAQRDLFERELRALEPAVREWYGREGLTGRARDASQFAYVGEVDVGGAFWRRFEQVCTTLPARGNFYLEWLLTGRYRDLSLGPPYLTPANHERLRDLVDRVQIVRSGLSDFLAETEVSFAAGNLSDVFEYLAVAEAERLREEVLSRLRHGGRLAYWELFVDRSGGRTPVSELLASDRVPFYNAFRVETRGQ